MHSIALHPRQPRIMNIQLTSAIILLFVTLVHSNYPTDSYGNPIDEENFDIAPKSVKKSKVETFRSLSFQSGDQKIVQKHIFFHEAPIDASKPSKKPQILLQPPQKHYKIVLIKTPTQTQTVRPILSPVKEEKTLIYVLVKKWEKEKIVTTTVAPTTPSKPEVYFIRYKAVPEKEYQDSGPYF